MSGDKVKITDNKLYINNAVQEETYIQDEKINLDFPETVVDEHAVFVLGDNRMDSLDSRVMGSIDIDMIIGKVIEVRHRN
ncbi:Signal peptidase I U [compost metagenome]